MGHHRLGNVIWKILFVTIRALTALTIISATILVGVLAGRAAAETFATDQHQRMFAAFLGAGLSLGSLERLLNHLPGVVRWLRTGDFSGLYNFSSVVFIVFLPLGAMMFGYVTPSNPTPPPHEPATAAAPVATANSVVFLRAASTTSTDIPASEATFIVPFFKDAKGCSDRAQAFKGGRTLDPATRDFINDLADGMLHCADADKPVKITVRGFASSQPFKDCGSDVSDRLNLRIANGRAESVVEAFQKGLSEARKKSPNVDGAVDITPVRWSSVEEMYQHLGFNDRVDDTYRRERGVLTRRAEVMVQDAGDCRVLSSPPLIDAQLSVSSDAAKDRAG